MRSGQGCDGIDALDQIVAIEAGRSQGACWTMSRSPG